MSQGNICPGFLVASPFGSRHVWGHTFIHHSLVLAVVPYRELRYVPDEILHFQSFRGRGDYAELLWSPQPLGSGRVLRPGAALWEELGATDWRISVCVGWGEVNRTSSAVPLC